MMVRSLRERRILLRRGVLSLILALLIVPAAAEAQDSLVFRIRTTYTPGSEPGFVVLPFTGVNAEAAAVRAIVRRDLEFSDRFRIRDAERAIRPGEAIESTRWAEGGADWLLAGELSPRAGGLTLRLALHDVRYGQVKGDRSFSLPPPRDPGFRMAVHAASDEVVRWATGEPGMAATRIAFVRAGRGTKEIYVVDSDGEDLRRITSDGSIALSPAWSPDGARLAFTSFRDGAPILYERELATGRDRVIAQRDGVNITPAYSPDGRTLAFASTVPGGTEVMLYDRVDRSLQPLVQGRRSDALSPTFSPRGDQIAFVSNRLGEPHIYVMERGGEPRLISGFRYGESGYNTSPDWSPRGAEIAYHTRVGGSQQIAIVGARGGTPRILTSGGRNEDPSWAPDGRHLVFASSGRDSGLYVVDTVSGRIRGLVRGSADGLPDWSASLLRVAPSP